MTEPLNVGLLLFLPYRAMETRVFEGLAAAGFDDLTPAQARVFQRIAPEGSRLTDLAAQAGITKQSAGFLVDQLERAGYVDRVPDPADGRARLVRIAERGARSVEASRGIVAEVEAEWTAHLGERRMDAAAARSSPTCARSPTRGAEGHARSWQGHEPGRPGKRATTRASGGDLVLSPTHLTPASIGNCPSARATRCSA